MLLLYVMLFCTLPCLAEYFDDLDTNYIVKKLEGLDTKFDDYETSTDTAVSGETFNAATKMLFQDIIAPVAAAGLIATPAGTASAAVGAFTAVVAAVYLIVKDKEPEMTLWEQIQSQLESRLRSFSTAKTFDNMKKHWHDMDMIISKVDTDIGLTDLEQMTTKKAVFFPQVHTTTGYTETWFSIVEAYMWYLSSIYYTLQANKKLDRCAWARELHVLRKDIVSAAADLAKKRYKDIDGVSYDDGHSQSGASQDFGRLSFIDKTVKKSYKLTFIVDVGKKVFGEIENEVISALKGFKERAFNVYVDKKSSGCNYPSKISDKEVTHRFQADFDGNGNVKRNVYGVAKDKTYSRQHHRSIYCALPCATYGWKTNWCVPKIALEGFDKNGKYLKFRSKGANDCSGLVSCYAECKRPSADDWNKAYPTLPIQHSQFFKDRMLVKIQKQNKASNKVKKDKKK